MPEQCAMLINDIVEARKARGWTQQELAEACNLTQSVIARIENKKSIPTLTTFQKIVFALGKSIVIVPSVIETTM